jgi:FkbM family methyltransferase
MSILSLLGRPASRRHLFFKIDRGIVRTIARLSSLNLFVLLCISLVFLILIPLVVLAGLVYSFLVMGRVILRKSRRQSFGSNMSVLSRIGDKNYRIVSDDEYLGRVEGVFEPEMSSLFMTLIRPNDIVLDVGANIGCTSILFGGLAKKVYSFEPSPTTFGYLQKNLSAANLLNVFAFNHGLGSHTSSETLTFSSDNRSGGFVSNKLHLEAGHLTEVITIVDGDSFLQEKNVDRVDFIKIDVEGFELEVLAGLKSVLKNSSPLVILEMNHWCLNAFQRISIPDFIDALLIYFPVLYAVNGEELLNLHDPEQRYVVTIEHITQGMKFQNLIGCYDHSRIGSLLNSR